MADEQQAVRLAVIGFGPRGLGAIEALATRTEFTQHQVHIDIFDPFTWLGAGPNFDPDQSEQCILNIPVRALDIDPPNILSAHFKPFVQWSATPYQPEDFPPRSDLGAYLNARFDALCDATSGRFKFTRHACLATQLKKSNGGWIVCDGATDFGPYAEVLLTQGQPKTAPDDQLKRWMHHASQHDVDLQNAYPANALLAAAQNWTDKTVAVRGMGLSTFDVLRLLTTGSGGEFSDGAYHASGNEPRAILPFSLTGLAPAAKPATQKIDALFDPTNAETDVFIEAFSRATGQTPQAAIESICNALIAPVLRISAARSNPVSHDNLRNWLCVECDDPGAQDGRDTVEALQSDIDMAYGRTPPSIGYCVGQIWRKWQNSIRSGFNPAPMHPDTAAAIIAFDEGLKRFSYGPPVRAAEEMLILIKQGLVRVNVVDDPDIILDPSGWQLSDSDETIMASVMIDAVLPSPDLCAVIDPLVSSCMAGGQIQIFAEGLGAKTAANGALNADDDGLCMLGRLALGSVIAADSLHDCFGESTHRWADGVIARQLNGRP